MQIETIYDMIEFEVFFKYHKVLIDCYNPQTTANTMLIRSTSENWIEYYRKALDSFVKENKLKKFVFTPCGDILYSKKSADVVQYISERYYTKNFEKLEKDFIAENLSEI